MRKKINLFVGSDIVAHREMGPIVAHMVEHGFEPVLYYPKHKTPSNPHAQQQFFKDYVFVERKILQDYIYPYLEANPLPNAPFQTPKQVAARYGLAEPVQLDSVNDPELLQKIIGDCQVVGSISLRCTQMFGKAATEGLKWNNRFLLNLHSGLLPEFRGLYSTPRAIAEALKTPDQSAREFGCTLHHIDPFTPVRGDESTRFAGIDTGNIVDIRSREINTSQSAYATNIQLSALGASAVTDAIDKYARGEKLRGHPQDERKGRYHTYASPQEIAEWQNFGLKMFDHDEVVRILIDTFSVPGSKHASKLEVVIRKALYDHLPPPVAQQQMNGNGSHNNAGTSFKTAAARTPAPAKVTSPTRVPTSRRTGRTSVSSPSNLVPRTA